MDWIHCNTCFKQPDYSNSIKFLLTSCGHFYCNICFKPGEKKKCVKCGSDFTTTELTSQISPDVQEYFQNPLDMVKKISQIMIFQNGHHNGIIAHYQQINAKYQAAKVEMKKMFDANKVLKKRNAELEMAAKYYQKKLLNINPAPVHRAGNATSTPRARDDHLAPFTPDQYKPAGPGRPSQPSQEAQLSLSQSNVWLTPNRLTLQFNKSLSTNTPPPEPSPNMSYNMSTPQLCSQRSDRDSFVTPSPLHHLRTPNVYPGAYRSGPSHYSSQPNTPQEGLRRSPATPHYNVSRSSISPTHSQSSTSSYRRSSLPPPITGRPTYVPRSPFTPPTSALSYIDLYSQRCRSSQK